MYLTREVRIKPLGLFPSQAHIIESFLFFCGLHSIREVVQILETL